METIGPKGSRASKMRALELHFPVWVFDLDQSVYPRKLASIPQSARPARMTGWNVWHREFGNTVWRIDDPLPAGVVSSKDCSFKSLGLAKDVLNRLRHDAQFDPVSFQVICEDGNSRMSRDFCNWCFDPSAERYVAAHRVIRIEQKWDGAPFWDRELKLNIFNNNELENNTVYGMAVLVHDDDELLQATGVTHSRTGDSIRKAEMELLDGERERVQGIVYPERFHPDHGLTLRRGPDFEWNREILTGTALENAPWSHVEDYVLGKRCSPLMLN